MTTEPRRSARISVCTALRRCVCALLAVLSISGCSLSSASEWLEELYPSAQSSGPSQEAPVSSDEASSETGSCLLSMYVIDVGQGLSVLLTGGGSSWLVDAGTYDGGRAAVALLKKLGIDSLDGIINTHPHYDHYGGIRAVLKDIPAGKYVTGIYPEGIALPDSYQYLIECLTDKHIPTSYLAAGDTVTGSGVWSMSVVGPAAEYGDLNNDSLVLLVSCSQISFLICGDMEAEAEAGLLASGADIAAQVLVVGHHGSSTSSTAEFLDAVGAGYAAISLGADNDYGYPHREVLERLITRGIAIRRTDLNGTIVYSTDGSSLTVSCDSP